MARPRVEIDETEVAKLAGYGCSDREIGDFFDVAHTTIKRRFAPILLKARAEMKHKLRKVQIEQALNGNVTMLIWLGKQYLDQSDKSEVEQRTTARVFDHRRTVADIAARSGVDLDTPGEG